MLTRIYIDNLRRFVNFEYRPTRKQLHQTISTPNHWQAVEAVENSGFGNAMSKRFGPTVAGPAELK